MTDDVAGLMVMLPYHLWVSNLIRQHRYGKAAGVLFEFLLATKRLRRYREPGGWVAITSDRLAWTGMSAATRIRGLRALEEMELVELRQEGGHAFRARLLYDAKALEGDPVYPDADIPIPKDSTERAIAWLTGKAA